MLHLATQKKYFLNNITTDLNIYCNISVYQSLLRNLYLGKEIKQIL